MGAATEWTCDVAPVGSASARSREGVRATTSTRLTITTDNGGQECVVGLRVSPIPSQAGAARSKTSSTSCYLPCSLRLKLIFRKLV